MLYILCKEDYNTGWPSYYKEKGSVRREEMGRGGGEEEKASRYCKHTSYSIMQVELDAQQVNMILVYAHVFMYSK